MATDTTAATYLYGRTKDSCAVVARLLGCDPVRFIDYIHTIATSTDTGTGITRARSVFVQLFTQVERAAEAAAGAREHERAVGIEGGGTPSAAFSRPFSPHKPS